MDMSRVTRVNNHYRSHEELVQAITRVDPFQDAAPCWQPIGRPHVPQFVTCARPKPMCNCWDDDNKGVNAEPCPIHHRG